MLAADDGARAEHWVARCAARALAADDARAQQPPMAREVGAPLMRALLAFARGEPARRRRRCTPCVRKAQRFGGSHAQRDLIDQTLLAAAGARSGVAIARSRGAQRAPLGQAAPAVDRATGPKRLGWPLR